MSSFFANRSAGNLLVFMKVPAGVIDICMVGGFCTIQHGNTTRPRVVVFLTVVKMGFFVTNTLFTTASQTTCPIFFKRESIHSNADNLSFHNMTPVSWRMTLKRSRDFLAWKKLKCSSKIPQTYSASGLFSEFFVERDPFDWQYTP